MALIQTSARLDAINFTFNALTPEEILQRQASIARAFAQQFKSTLTSSKNPSAQNAAFDATTGMHRVTLSDGSIVYSDSLSNGTIASGDEVLLLDSEGIPYIDAPPHIKPLASSPTPYLPHKCSGRVAILFTKEVFDRKELEWRGTFTYRYLMYGFYLDIANARYGAGAPPNWTGFDFNRREPDSARRFPSDEFGRYYSEVYVDGNVYRHCFFGQVGYGQYAEDGEWRYFPRYFRVESNGISGSFPGIIIEFSQNVTLGESIPALPEIGARILNLEPDYYDRVDDSPCVNSSEYTGGAAWGLLEDETLPGDAYQEEVDIYRYDFYLGGYLPQPIPLTTPIKIDVGQDFIALISVTKEYCFVKILFQYEFINSRYKYVWLYRIDLNNQSIQTTFYNAPQQIIPPSGDWQAPLYENYGLVNLSSDNPCFYDYSYINSPQNNTYNFKSGYKSLMYVEEWTDLVNANNSNVKIEDKLVKVIQERAGVLSDNGGGGQS